MHALADFLEEGSFWSSKLVLGDEESALLGISDNVGFDFTMVKSP